MKTSFLLTIIMISLSQATLAMEIPGITRQHLHDLARLACAINNHDKQAYDAHPDKENLTYDILEALVLQNMRMHVDLNKNLAENNIINRLFSTGEVEAQIEAHRQIGLSLGVLMERQEPIRAEAAKKRCQELSHLAEYKCRKEFEEAYKQRKQQQALLAAQQAENKQENPSVS